MLNRALKQSGSAFPCFSGFQMSLNVLLWHQKHDSCWFIKARCPSFPIPEPEVCQSPFSQMSQGSLQRGTLRCASTVCFNAGQERAGLSVVYITRCCAHSSETRSCMTSDPRCPQFYSRSTVRDNKFRATDSQGSCWS